MIFNMCSEDKVLWLLCCSSGCEWWGSPSLFARTQWCLEQRDLFGNFVVIAEHLNFLFALSNSCRFLISLSDLLLLLNALPTLTVRVDNNVSSTTTWTHITKMMTSIECCGILLLYLSDFDLHYRRRFLYVWNTFLWSHCIQEARDSSPGCSQLFAKRSWRCWLFQVFTVYHCKAAHILVHL